MNTLTSFDTPGGILTAQAKARPDDTVMKFPEQGTSLTFAEWEDTSSALARALLEIGLRPGDHIGLLAQARVEWPAVQLAVAKMGGVLVPLNTHYAKQDLAYALEHSQIRCLVLSEAFRSNRYLEMAREIAETLSTLDTLVCLDGPLPGCLDYRDLLAKGRISSTVLPDIAPDDVASLQYTSGTTGFPKGALLTHAGMLANAWGITERLRVTSEDRWTSIIPLFHCAGCIMCMLGTLQRGCCYIGVEAFDPIKMFETIQDESCTILSGVPTSNLAMLNHPERKNYDMSSLRAGTCGGADTDPQLLRQCAEEFPMAGVVQVYGQTEASTLISLADCKDAARFETCGPPLTGAQVRIAAPDTGKLCAPGEVGQIETAGPMVMKGYFRNDEATAETIGPDGWMRTGDLGYLTPEGYVVVAGGRLRDMIIRGGENIYPVEIENILRLHPAVAELAVFGVADDYYGEIVAVAVTLNEDVSAKDLLAFCEGRIAKFKIPAIFYRVETFPLTASGKIRKTELNEMARRGALDKLL